MLILEEQNHLLIGGHHPLLIEFDPETKTEIRHVSFEFYPI